MFIIVGSIMPGQTGSQVGAHLDVPAFSKFQYCVQMQVFQMRFASYDSIITVTYNDNSCLAYRPHKVQQGHSLTRSDQKQI